MLDTRQARAIPFGRRFEILRIAGADAGDDSRIVIVGRVGGGENIEASLEPVGESAGDLEGFVPLVVGGANAVLDFLGA